jgi:hypothetical protein
VFRGCQLPGRRTPSLSASLKAILIVCMSLLGRDPEQHPPPRLSWDLLIELLDRHGITMTEEGLIATPFVFEFSDELLAELAH